MFQKNFNVSTVLIGLLYLVLGIVFIAATDELLKTFNYILVCICFIIGVIQMLSFFLEREHLKDDYTSLLIGVVFVWVSLVLYVYYGFMINILPILFSLYGCRDVGSICSFKRCGECSAKEVLVVRGISDGYRHFIDF